MKLVLLLINSNKVDTCDGVSLVAISGDISVVTRWTVDQEVVGSNPTHGRN